jgi:hypothetical protein
MPLPQTHIQERLSMAYIRAVVASAGANFTSVGESDFGIDCYIALVTMMEDGSSFTQTGHLLQAQVKSTTNWIEKDEFLLYDLEAKAYNKLVAFESKTAILIVLKLPKNEKEWLKCTEDCMELQNCCYWVILDGPQTTNTSSIRIPIPRKQIFDPNAVSYLLEFLGKNHGSLI